MKEIKVVKATIEHKEFILYANQIINSSNNTKDTNRLEENINKDYFLTDKPKFKCLIAKIDNKPVRYDFIFIFLLGE